VAGNDFNFIGKSEQTVVNGREELAGVASGEVGAANRAGEEGVSGQQERLVGKVEADAAFGMAGGVQDRTGDT